MVLDRDIMTECGKGKAGKIVYPWKKWNWILTHTKPKNQLQMDEELKCQKQILKTWEENISKYLPKLKIGKNLWRHKKC